jgi:hypothetical protein
MDDARRNARDLCARSGRKDERNQEIGAKHAYAWPDCSQRHALAAEEIDSDAYGSEVQSGGSSARACFHRVRPRIL